MTHELLLGFLAILPCAALLVFFVRNSRGHAQPLGSVLMTALLGSLAVGGAWGLQTLARNDFDFAPRSFFFCFAIVACSEETLKYLAAWNASADFSEPYDGIVFAVAAALGFAFAENMRYVLLGGVMTGLIRAILAVPAHALFGVSMGYFLGRARFCHARSDKLWNGTLAWLIPVLMHGLYDYTVGQAAGLRVLLFPLVGLFWLAGLWQMDLQISLSPFRFSPVDKLGRRAWARYQVDSPASVRVGGKDIPVFILDIGLGGAQFAADEPVEVEKEAELVLDQAPAQLVLGFDVLKGRALGHGQLYRCRFVTLSWRTRKRLEIFLREVKERASETPDPSPKIPS